VSVFYFDWKFENPTVMIMERKRPTESCSQQCTTTGASATVNPPINALTTDAFLDYNLSLACVFQLLDNAHVICFA
jgi:hypothetical protein